MQIRQNTRNEESQLEMCRRIHLKLSDYDIIKEYCEEVGIEFLSTPFDLESIDYLEKLGMKLWKIPSGEITNLPYLIKIAKTGKPVIMSTGMAELKEVEEAVNVLKEGGAGEITLLHCTTEYPAPFDSVNLKAMNTLREKLGTKVGYSDHTAGIEVVVAAVSLGATVIEKHFTLNRNLEGPDHKASLEPEELEVMVNKIRIIEKALGDGIKRAAEAEKKNIVIARKSIVAAKDIKKGEILSEDNITTKRPGNGISPMQWFEVLGTEAIRDFGEDELIEV